VGVEKTGDVARGFQAGVPDVAGLATEGIIDLVVANQAVGHLRHSRRGDMAGLFQPAVACLAGISGIQVTPNVPGRLEIRFLIDRSSDQWSRVAHLQMLRVTEPGYPRGWRSRDFRLLVTLEAHGLSRKKIVFHLCACRCGRMTGGALQL
jgi:hypothetical protein